MKLGDRETIRLCGSRHRNIEGGDTDGALRWINIFAGVSKASLEEKKWLEEEGLSEHNHYQPVGTIDLYALKGGCLLWCFVPR